MYDQHHAEGHTTNAAEGEAIVIEAGGCRVEVTVLKAEGGRLLFHAAAHASDTTVEVVSCDDLASASPVAPAVPQLLAARWAPPAGQNFHAQ